MTIAEAPHAQESTRRRFAVEHATDALLDGAGHLLDRAFGMLASLDDLLRGLSSKRSRLTFDLHLLVADRLAGAGLGLARELLALAMIGLGGLCLPLPRPS